MANCTGFYDVQPFPTVLQQMEALGSWGSGIAIFGACSTFLLSILYVLHIYHLVRYCPPSTRRILAWIISFPLLISILALISFVSPRNAVLSDILKHSYIPFLLMHLVDLSLQIQGGHKDVLKDLSKEDEPSSMSFCVLPCCCVGLCFRDVSYNKKKLRFIKGLVYQTPLVQLVIMTLTAFLENAEILQRTVSNIAFLLLTLLLIITFMLGIWGFNVLTSDIAAHSNWTNYLVKARVLSFSIIFLKIQLVIMFILAIAGALPCVPPHVSVVSLRRTIEAGLTLFECLIMGVVFFFLYRGLEEEVEDVTRSGTASISSPSACLVNDDMTQIKSASSATAARKSFSHHDETVN